MLIALFIYLFDEQNQLKLILDIFESAYVGVNTKSCKNVVKAFPLPNISDAQTARRYATLFGGP